MALTPSERSMRARLAAHTAHARHGSDHMTAAARAAFERRFLDEVDPDRRLPEEERLRRAAHAKSAHFTRLALESAKARRAGLGSKARSQQQRDEDSSERRTFGETNDR